MTATALCDVVEAAPGFGGADAQPVGDDLVRGTTKLGGIFVGQPGDDVVAEPPAAPG